MKHIEVTDEWLYKYMPMASEIIVQRAEEQIDEEYQFSARFERRMKRLIRKESRYWLKDFGRVLGKAAVICLCVIGLLFIITMRVDAYRNKFFQTVQELWEDAFKQTYSNGWEEQGFVPHEPTYIPEGYRGTDKVSTEHSCSISYENGQGNRIVWDQMLASDQKENILDAEYEANIIERVADGYVYVYAYEDGYIGAYYETDQYIYMIMTDNLSLDEVYRMIESLE